MAKEETLWSWVHVSDIHFSHGKEPYQADQKALISGIDDDVKLVLGLGEVPSPQAILVTGDVGSRGGTTTGGDGKKEYDAAAEFIEKLKKTLGESLKKSLPEKSLPEMFPVYVVPGNHDVKRTDPKEVKASKLLVELRNANSVPNLDAAVDKTSNGKILKNRFANYTEFCKRVGSPIGAGVDGLWDRRVSIDGALGVHLIGLNTAFLCNDDSDRGVLNLPHDSVVEVFENKRSGDLVFVLTHHPTDWLNPADVLHVTQKIRQHRCIHLHGHIHEAEIKQTHYGTGESVVTIAAGALHADELESKIGTPHTYSFGALVKLEDGSVVIRIWPRRWTRKNNGWNWDFEQLPPTEKYVQFVLIRPIAIVPPAAIEYVLDQTNEILNAYPEWEKDRYSNIQVPVRHSQLLDAEPKEISPDFELVERHRDSFTSLRDELASLVESNADPGEAAGVGSELRLLLEGVYQQRLTFDGENRDATGSAVTPEEVLGELTVMPTAAHMHTTSLDTSTTGSDGYIG